MFKQTFQKQQFKNNDSIEIVRKQVEKYEKLVKEQAERVERVKQNCERIEDLQQNMKTLKRQIIELSKNHCAVFLFLLKKLYLCPIKINKKNTKIM